MAAGVLSKSDAAVQQAALEREVAGARRTLAERDAQLAHMANLVAEAEAARAKAPAAAETNSSEAPHPAAPPPDPVAAARAKADGDLSALAIVAREMPEKGSRKFWLDAIEQLGRHLAPDASPAERQRAALSDPRGRAFVEARQACAQ